MVKSSKSPSSVDALVGQRIKERRQMLQISQETLGERLGVSFQQIQKYEKGLNRIGAGRLKELADILCIDVNYFFSSEFDKSNMLQETQVIQIKETLDNAMTIRNYEDVELISAFNRINDNATRRKLIDLVSQMAED